MIVEDEGSFPSMWDLNVVKVSSVIEAKTPPGPIVTQLVSHAHEYQRGSLLFINEYQILCLIGQGSYGKVYKVQREYLDKSNNPTKSIYAMKVYDKTYLSRSHFFSSNMELIDSTYSLRNQLNIIKRLSNENILRCYQTIEDQESEKVYIVMDYCNYGTIMVYQEMKERYERNGRMMEFIQGRYWKRFKKSGNRVESIAKVIFYQVGKGLLYLHEQNITHRDIKVDNILARTEDLGEEIKLGDFNTVRYSDDGISNQPAGTLHYRCPDQQFAHEKGYFAKSADIWSLGITIYLFCFQKFPFDGSTEHQINSKILKDQIQCPSTASPQLVNLLKKMTLKQQFQRPNIKQFLKDPWFNQILS